jgi:cell division protein FtsB
MLIEPQVIDDLKTERPDVTPPLPLIARLVPILFYVSMIGSILLCGLFAFRLQEVAAARENYKAQERQSREQLQALRDSRQTLEARAKRASDLQVWTETARPLQPIIVELARSLDPDSTLAELRLTRATDNPRQLRFALKLNTNTVQLLDRMLQQLQARGYRSYTPEQRLARGEIDYQATLVWQNPSLLLQEDEASDTP